MNEEKWYRYYIDFNSYLFKIINDHLKKSNKNHKAINIHILNEDRMVKLKSSEKIIDDYKIILDWQEDDICGIEVYKKIKE